MKEKIGSGWSGIVTREVVEPLAQAIEQQFGGKLFSTMGQSWYEDSPFPQRKEATSVIHRRLDKIKPFFDESDAYIYLIAYNNWTIHTGSFVCLTERSLLVEIMHTNGHDVWCWMLEE